MFPCIHVATLHSTPAYITADTESMIYQMLCSLGTYSIENKAYIQVTCISLEFGNLFESVIVGEVDCIFG